RKAEWNEMRKFYSAGANFETAVLLAREIAPHLTKAGIAPALASDNPAIFTSRQADSDIEYLFAVNAAWDDVMADYNSIRASRTVLTMADDGRPIYDAILGGEARWEKKNGKLAAELRFGAGQMRAWARTSRPIGGVKALTPSVQRDFSREKMPAALEAGAALLDNTGRILAGAAPLEIRIVDPLGHTRYHLYRATQQGVWRETLPLAANDPAGEWQILVKDLLANTEDSLTFAVNPVPQCGALAGAARRAIVFGRDEENIYRFFRIYRRLTIVKGEGDYDAIAERLARSLKPWDIACDIVTAADVNKPRPVSEEEAATWAGPNETGRGQVKPGAENSPHVVGYDIANPAILIGTPEDNPLIKGLVPGTHRGVLPYMPQKNVFPGTGRGSL
ncbi:MAG: hypothetical protein N3A66_11230, partial [Planctomycetota bacterium]|nr:hypothetical protein [Planctomycetota bacterium]